MRRRRLLLAALGSWWFILLTKLARDKPFWHDEVYTVLVARLPLGTLWRASLGGVDLSPPFNTILTRAVHLVVGVGPVATRLLPIASFIATSLLLFVFVRRRSNALMGLTAALLPAYTSAWSYATEARGYALTMACFVAALYGWSEAAAGRHVRANLAVMAIALAAGMWTHYYFVLAFVPIIFGELVRQVTRRRSDPGFWAALGVVAVATVPLLPLAAIAARQRATFWARPAHLEFADVYYFVFGSLAGRQWQRIAGTILIVTVGTLACLPRINRESRRLARHDTAACVACLLVPAGGVVLGYWTGAFTERYLIFSVAGLMAALPLLVWAVAPANGAIDLVAVVACLATLVGLSRHALSNTTPPSDSIDARSIVAERMKTADPLIVTGAVDYLSVWYYTPAEFQPRVIYLADPAAELDATGSDTVDRGYLALARWTLVPVMPLADFVQTHRRFWLYALGTEDKWIEPRLRSWSASFTPAGGDRSGRLFDVQLPERQ
jgi:dolichyl-phosphate-mannose-protein mannosyltransferase